jgi:hypothetical protein
MATGTVGSLVVQLGLDAAQFTSGLSKADFQAQQFSKNLSNQVAIGIVKAEAAMKALGEAASFVIRELPELVRQAGNFQDLAEKTGASAEALASFGVAAAVGGTSVEGIAAASVKLTKNLTGVDDESKAAGAAIAALGLNLGDFKKLAPEDQISAISKALAGFEDGANKTAVATALFGKSGADLLPFLKALDEQGGRQVILTAQQIALADEYADKQAKSRAELQQYAQALATQAIPSITAFTGAISDTIKEILSLGKGATDLKNNNAVSDFAESAVRALGFVVDAADGVARVFQITGNFLGAAAAGAAALANRDFKGALNIAKDADAQIGAILDRPLFSAKLDARLKEAKNVSAGGQPQSAKKKLTFNGAEKSAGGAGDDPTKKLLDNQLKTLENAVRDEEDLLRSRNKILDLYNGENLISTQAYFEAKRVAQAAAVSSQIALYDQEIAALEKYKNAPGRKAIDQEAAQGKINDLQEKQRRLIREKGETAIEWGFRERKAAEDLGKQINSVNAEILELTGNLAAATRIRLGDQFSDLRQRLTANGDTQGLAQVDKLEKLKIAQADFNQQQEIGSDLLESLRIEEERLALSQQLGAFGALEGLSKVGAARQKIIEQYRAVVLAEEAIGRASGNQKLIQNAERARLELEKLQAVADPLADKFNTLFADSAGSALSDFITGTKTAKEAFKSFTDTIFKELTNLIVKDLFKQLFSGASGGGSGGGFNIGSVLSSVFGGGKGILGFADGGVPPVGKVSMVGERGPELFVPNTAGRIIPNDMLGRVGSSSSNVYNINVRVPEGTSRSTGSQIAADLQRKLAYGSRNN